MSLGNHENHHPRMVMDLCTNIILNPHHNTEEELERRTVYVFNGEDEREIFHVPPFQFSDAGSILLVVNSINRTISIIHDGLYKSVSRGDAVSTPLPTLTH